MTEEERDNGLESLFRNRLEENEVVTGSDLTGRFMRRLGRREFFRFNPARFNIYYLTVAAAALTVAGVILFSGPDDTGAATVTGSQPETASEAAAPDKEITREEVPVTDISPETAPAKVYGAGPEKEAGNEPRTDESGRETSVIPGVAAPEPVPVSTITKEKATVVQAPVTILSADASVTSGCLPLNVSFRSNAGDDMKITWSFGDGGVSSLRNPDYIYDLPGKFVVTMKATDSRGRISEASTVIEVYDRPVAAFEIQDDRSVDEGDRVRFTNLSTGAVEYLWDFGDGTFSTLSDPVYRYREAGKYEVKLVVWSAAGCSDSLTVSDLFTDRAMFIKFPNAFVPNKGGPTGGYYNQRTDEESQVFHPVASGIASYNLKIYSKSGLLVFESNEIEMGWDGYHRGRLCAPGVYVWKVRGTYRNGGQFIMAGDVTLLNY